MNILQISDGNKEIPPKKSGPIESVIFNISKCMVKLGHNVTILTRKFTKGDLDYEYSEGIRIIRLNSKKINYRSSFLSLILAGVDFAFKANSWIKKADNFNVIHVHLPLAAIVLINLNRKITKKNILYVSW